MSLLPKFLHLRTVLVRGKFFPRLLAFYCWISWEIFGAAGMK